MVQPSLWQSFPAQLKVSSSASHSISHGTAKSHLTAQSLYLQHLIAQSHSLSKSLSNFSSHSVSHSTAQSLYLQHLKVSIFSISKSQSLHLKVSTNVSTTTHFNESKSLPISSSQHPNLFISTSTKLQHLIAQSHSLSKVISHHPSHHPSHHLN